MIEVRYAFRQDISTIVDFQKQMALEAEGVKLEDELVKMGVNAVFDNPDKGRYIVAANDSKVIACLMITSEWSDWRNGYFLWIQSLFVIPEFRNKGIFKKLYQFLQNIVIESADYHGLRLYVEKNNLVAQEVYNKMGMDGNHYKMFEWMKK